MIELFEAKKNEFVGILEEIEESQPMRNGGSFNRIKVDGLWFTLLPESEGLRSTELELGTRYLVNYWVSESDFGRSYRNISKISIALPNVFQTQLGAKLDTILKELDIIKGMIKNG